jgi:hypothetical protein
MRVCKLRAWGLQGGRCVKVETRSRAVVVTQNEYFRRKATPAGEICPIPVENSAENGFGGGGAAPGGQGNLTHKRARASGPRPLTYLRGGGVLAASEAIDRCTAGFLSRKKGVRAPAAGPAVFVTQPCWLTK